MTEKKETHIRVGIEGVRLLERLRVVNGARAMHHLPPLKAGKLAIEGLRPAIEEEEARWEIPPPKEGEGQDEVAS